MLAYGKERFRIFEKIVCRQTSGIYKIFWVVVVGFFFLIDFKYSNFGCPCVKIPFFISGLHILSLQVIYICISTNIITDYFCLDRNRYTRWPYSLHMDKCLACIGCFYWSTTSVSQILQGIVIGYERRISRARWSISSRQLRWLSITYGLKCMYWWSVVKPRSPVDSSVTLIWVRYETWHAMS